MYPRWSHTLILLTTLVLTGCTAAFPPDASGPILTGDAFPLPTVAGTAQDDAAAAATALTEAQGSGGAAAVAPPAAVTTVAPDAPLAAPAVAAPAVPPAALAPAPAAATAVAASGMKAPGVSAAAYVVTDAATGAMLLGYQAEERRPMASLTKVMTALLALERVPLDDTVEVSDAVARFGRGSSLMGVKPGERLSVRDLLYGAMLPSGNDAALALALHVSGSEAAFVELMNQRARALGLRDTHFANPHGLDSRQGDHYASAADLAQLARAALANAELRTIMAARSWTATGAQRSYSMVNGNLLLTQYPGADGMKIGYTRTAGQTIIGTAVRAGQRLVVVALGSAQRVADAALLLDHAWAALSAGASQR